MNTPTYSSSGHFLNADTGLSVAKKIQWIYLNAINNISFFHNTLTSLPIRNFSPTPELLDQLDDKTSSPSRLLSNLFWHSLPWSRIQQEIGQLHILDVGCGSGNYGLRLAEINRDHFKTYFGTDVRANPNWETLSKKSDAFQFKADHIDNIQSNIPPQTNLIISQSFLEHIEQDLLFFKNIHQWIENSSNPVIQIHLVPAAACLPLYFFHGVRQYPYHALKKIADIYKDSSVTICSLGGAQTNRVHWNYISWPTLLYGHDLRQKYPEQYSKEIKQTIIADAKKKTASPSFWAIIIQSHVKKNIYAP